MIDTEQGAPLTTAHARDLADDLLRQLTPHVGNQEAVDAILLRWLEVLDVAGLALVSVLAVQRTFVDCLTVTDSGDVPAGSLAFEVTTEPEKASR